MATHHGYLNCLFLKMEGREDAAKYYLNKHKIPELIQNMTSALVYDRPEDPRKYMIDFIRRLQDSKAVKMDYPNIFDESNLISLFGILDPSSKGYISHEKYLKGMENIGVASFNKSPSGSDANQITLDVFLHEAKLGLENASATFST